MRGEAFVSLPPVREGYQPPESPDEIEEATRIAHQDERIRIRFETLKHTPSWPIQNGGFGGGMPRAMDIGCSMSPSQKSVLEIHNILS